MNDDAIGINAVLYTVSKIAQNTVINKESQDPGRVSRIAVNICTK